MSFIRLAWAPGSIGLVSNQKLTRQWQGSPTLQKLEWINLIAWDEAGTRFQAPCGPFPSLLNETLADALAGLENYSELLRTAEDFELVLHSQSIKLLTFNAPPALRTSLELLHLQAMWPALASNFKTKNLSAPYENSKLMTLDRSLAFSDAEIEAAAAAGFHTFKFKYVPKYDRELVQLMQRLRHFIPELIIRLDCNQGLSEQEFLALERRLKHMPIAFYEEPLRNREQLKRLARSVPVAIDEALQDEQAEDLKHLSQAWIIKPNVLGLVRTLDLFRQAEAENKDLVLSNAFEAKASLQCYAWFYQALITRKQVCGFGTVDFISDESEGWPVQLAKAAWPETPWRAALHPSEGQTIWTQD